MPIKMVAIDLDGTLLNSHHQLSPRNEQALRAAMGQGVHVVLATGKTRFSALPIIDHLKLTTPGIYNQGLIVYAGDGTICFQHTIGDDIARFIVDYAEQYELSLLVYSGITLFTNQFTNDPSRITQYGEPDPELISPLMGIIGTVQINKLIFMATASIITAIRADLTAQLNGQATVIQALDDMLEIMPNGISKGTAFNYLVQHFGLQSDETMAIGNAENDIPMIQSAGIGVAVANAMPSLISVADEVVPSNDEDGVAVAIERYVLNRSED